MCTIFQLLQFCTDKFSYCSLEKGVPQLECTWAIAGSLDRIGMHTLLDLVSRAALCTTAGLLLVRSRSPRIHEVYIATYLWYSPRFPLAPAFTFATSLFAAAITREGRLWDRGPLGSGRPSLGSTSLARHTIKHLDRK